MAVLTQFFCKMYFLCVSQSRKKKLGNFFLVLPPERAVFFRGGPVFQGGGAAGIRHPLSGKVLLDISNGLSRNYDELFFSWGVPGCPDFQGGGAAGTGTPSLEKCC